MPRVARRVIEDVPHHITQRGNNKQDIFFVDDDRRAYLDILKRQSDQYGLAIMGYCLMVNHIHLLVVPRQRDSLAKAVGRTHFIYTQYINRLHNRSGHLWQGRFYSCALDDRHFLYAMRYIERNPLRVGICSQAWKYAWSSASEHIGEKRGNGILDLKGWFEKISGGEWKNLLKVDLDMAEMTKIRSNTHTGRPLGSDSFLSKLEKKIGFRLRPLPVGRPKWKGENR